MYGIQTMIFEYKPINLSLKCLKTNEQYYHCKLHFYIKMFSNSVNIQIYMALCVILGMQVLVPFKQFCFKCNLISLAQFAGQVLDQGAAGMYLNFFIANN
jgi:hypothetical protein